VADQSVFLRLRDQSFMYELRQFHGCEFGESAREGSLVRDLPGLFPAADPAQLRIIAQALDQIACQGDSIGRFGNEGA
jgi:hypothetical protein